MNLLQISIENFRIFFGKHTFSFSDKKLIIVRGLNGHGKSSFFDAIEWCLTGDIQRYVGSDERNKFHYIVHQSLISQRSILGDRIPPKASVELWIQKSEGECIKIKRLYHAEKRIAKPIVIDGIAYAVKTGNQKIRELLFYTPSQDNGKKDLSKLELPVLLSSTQFLSQDQLQAFVSAKKPQDRYAVLEKVLGLQKYGSEFQQYIKQVREIIEGQNKEIYSKIRDISEQVKINQGIAETKEDLLKKIGSETEESLIQKITALVSQINENEPVFPLIQPKSLSDSIQTELLKFRKLLQERKAKYETNCRLLHDANEILSFSNVDYDNKIFEVKEALKTLSEKKARYQLGKQRAIKKQLDLTALQGYRKNYQETLLLLNNLYVKIKENNDARKHLLNDPILQAANQLHNDLEAFQVSYKEQLNNNKWLNEYLQVLDKEEKLQSTKEALVQLKQKIITESNHMDQSNLIVNRLREKKTKIMQMVEGFKNNATAQMIHTIQSHVLQEQDEHTPCPVCGTKFLDPSSLHTAVKLKLEETSKILDKNEIALRDINTEISMYETDAAKFSHAITELIQQRDSLTTQIQKEEIGVARDRAKIPIDIQGLKEESANVQAKKSADFLKLNKEAFQLCLALNSLEKEIVPLTTQEVTLTKTLQDLRKYAEKRVGLLESSEGVIEHRLQRIEMYLMLLNDVEKRMSTQIIKWNTTQVELENKKREKEIKLTEIRKLFPEFDEDERQTLIDQLMGKINFLRKWDIELEEQLTKIEAFLSNNNIMVLKTELSDMTLHLKREENKSKHYEGLLNQLKQLDQDHSKVQSELMNDYLQRYSEKIDDLFVQISPHAFFRHVHLVPKDGELYIVVSDKKEGDLSKLSPEELEKRFNASLTFSSAQSNVLAVCIFLALGLSQEWTPLQTIGIDDPFQNLDDINVFSFLDVLSQILSDKQVIISTHDDKFANLIRYKSSLENKQITEIWLESYSKESISIQSDSLIETADK
jgi:exonuclease SbcC